jgi:hypothetical protein
VSHPALLEKIYKLQVESDRQSDNYKLQQGHHYRLHALNLSSKIPGLADVDSKATAANCVLAVAVLILRACCCKWMQLTQMERSFLPVRVPHL